MRVEHRRPKERKRRLLAKGKNVRVRKFFPEWKLRYRKGCESILYCLPPLGRGDWLSLLWWHSFSPRIINVSPWSKSIMGVVNGSKIFAIKTINGFHHGREWVREFFVLCFLIKGNASIIYAYKKLKSEGGKITPPWMVAKVWYRAQVLTLI